MRILLTTVLFLILAPVAGGLLTGVDRIVSARMQNRVGPPVLQPFYDFFKLLQKENVIVNVSQNIYSFCFLLFTVFTGALFFNGADFLIIVFSSTLAGVFYVLGGYSAFSPYSFIGAERELLSMVSEEPMVILTAIGMYMVTKSFYISDIVRYASPLLYTLPGIFIGFIFILTVKLKKSPFDISTAAHAHQELVSGITTEFSGKTLAFIELAHWYENIYLMGIIYLFFAPCPAVGIVVALLAYFLEILVDNTNARVKWQQMFKSAWIVSIVAGALNILILYIVQNA